MKLKINKIIIKPKNHIIEESILDYYRECLMKQHSVTDLEAEIFIEHEEVDNG